MGCTDWKRPKLVLNAFNLLKVVSLKRVERCNIVVFCDHVDSVNYMWILRSKDN